MTQDFPSLWRDNPQPALGTLMGSYDYWSRAGVLLPCDYCKAPPFEMCHTVTGPTGITNEPRTLTGQVHSNRFHAGKKLMRRMLETTGPSGKRLADRDEPKDPPLTYETVVEIVMQALQEAGFTPQP